MSKKYKCFICGEETDENQDVVSLKGESAHPECQDNQSTSSSTCFEFLPDGDINKTDFDEDFIYSSDADDYDQLPGPIKSQKWVSSDGWRGYTDWKLKKGYIEVGDGWVTQWPDENHERKLELAEIFEKLQGKKIIVPCPVFWVFGPTSNVFSTASIVVIEKENKKIFEKWLKKINGGLEEFQEKFA